MGEYDPKKWRLQVAESFAIWCNRALRACASRGARFTAAL